MNSKTTTQKEIKIMKTKFYWVALLASAALIAQAQAGGHHSGGGGGNFAAAGPGPARSGGGPSFGSMPSRSFGGGRMIYSGQRFSSIGMRAPGYGQHYINPNGGATVRARQFTPGNINRGNRSAQFSNTGNRAVGNLRQSGNGARQVRSGNNLPTNWRNHVVAQHSGNWQRNWDRSRDHVWHGHHCRFINGSWVIFDFGFDPWWPYWYPYDYYAYGYPYGYDPGYYDSGADQNGEYYSQNGYGDYADSTVAAAQQRLAREGYYRGQIDGVIGPETQRAVARYQSSHGLRVTGALTADTLEALGLRPS
jgi:Putative peptidoglycan binding domain